MNINDYVLCAKTLQYVAVRFGIRCCKENISRRYNNIAAFMYTINQVRKYERS